MILIYININIKASNKQHDTFSSVPKPAGSACQIRGEPWGWEVNGHLWGGGGGVIVGLRKMVEMFSMLLLRCFRRPPGKPAVI